MREANSELITNGGIFLKISRISKALFAFLLCAILVLSVGITEAPSVYAKTQAEINAQISELEKQSQAIEREIAALKSKKATQNAIKNKIEAQIANTQAQINLCNSRINQYNAEIAENEAKIAQKEQEKQDTIFLFKQRLRTIHMSNGSSTLQVLLGAENFSDYLALAQLTKVITAHDQKIVEQIIELVEEINAAQVVINERIEAQNEVKATLAQKRAELDTQVAAVNSVISSINAETNSAQSDNKAIENEIRALEAELAPYINMTTSAVYDGSAFTWPVPGHYSISSGFGRRWGTWHKGIDINDRSIYNAAIVAIADGVVVKSYNSCGHNYGKKRSCGCGSGWGNHVMIDHGSSGGTNYKSLCGHMTRTAVSVGQTVKKGQVIGYVGSTGYSTGFHCHFEIYVNGNRVNPMNYYNKVR